MTAGENIFVQKRSNVSGSSKFPSWTFDVLNRTTKVKNNTATVISQREYGHTFAPDIVRRYKILSDGSYFLSPKGYSRFLYQVLRPSASSWNCSNSALFVESGIPSPLEASTQFDNSPDRPSAIPATINSLISAGPDWNRLKNEAITKCLGNLSGSKAQLGETLATMSQNADLFANLSDQALRVLKAYRQMRKLTRISDFAKMNVRKLMYHVRKGNVRKFLANQWLQFWFGLKPLISDVKGVFDVLAQLSRTPSICKGFGRSLQTTNGELSSHPIVGSYPWPGYVHRYEQYATVQCGVYAEYDSLSREFNRLGLLNPPALAWELIPFSFVVDWFIPVGKTLEALSARVGLSFIGGFITQRVKRIVSSEVHPAYQRGESALHVITHKMVNIQRSTLGDFPIPGFYTKPFFTGASRFATMAALINNIVDSVKRKRAN